MKKYEVHVQNWKDGELEHDYNIVIGEGGTSLNRSNSPRWSESARNEMVGSLIDDGNGVSIQLKDKKKPITLDYAQLAELQMLLMASTQRDYVTVIKESTPVLRYSGLSD
jgi:hypothetical protein